MITLWIKDLRAMRAALLSFLGFFAAMLVADAALGIKDATHLYPFALFIGGHYLGALPLGLEYDHGTLPLLLTQPQRRRRIWLGKLMLSFTLVMALYGSIVGAMEWRGTLRPGLGWFMATFALTAFCGPPLFVHHARSTLGAAAVSFLALILLITGGAMAIDLLLHLPLVDHQAFFLWLAGGYGLLALALATWKWNTLEVLGRAGEVSSAPSRSSLIPLPTAKRGTPWRNLWSRELILQFRTIAFGSALTVLLWIDLALLQNRTWGPFADPMLPLLLLLPAWIIPLFAGLSCGQEKYDGTQALTTLLPFSFPLQMRVRLIVGIGIALVFGLLIPHWGERASRTTLTAGGVEVDALILGISALICFALGWFGTGSATTSLGAAGIAAALVGTTLSAWTALHHWFIPWLVVFSGLIHRPNGLIPEWGPASSYWNADFLFAELHDHPSQLGWFALTALIFIGCLIRWAAANARHDHIPIARNTLRYSAALGILLLAQLVMGTHLCLRFLRG